MSKNFRILLVIITAFLEGARVHATLPDALDHDYDPSNSQKLDLETKLNRLAGLGSITSVCHELNNIRKSVTSIYYGLNNSIIIPHRMILDCYSVWMNNAKLEHKIGLLKEHDDQQRLRKIELATNSIGFVFSILLARNGISTFNRNSTTGLMNMHNFKVGLDVVQSTLYAMRLRRLCLR